MLVRWWIRNSSHPLKIEAWWLINCCWCCLWCCISSSFCLRSSTTFRWEFECLADTKVGLAAGRYSGTSRPDLYRTPQALHRVFGPIGPVLHCGVFSDAQWRHLRPVVSMGSLFFGGAALGFEEGERRRRREDQSQGAARERLLRAFPGTDTSDGKIGGGGELVVMTEEEVVSAVTALAAAVVLVAGMKRRSSVEKDSSTKLESHSSSAKSSYCLYGENKLITQLKKKGKKNQIRIWHNNFLLLIWHNNLRIT